MSAPEWRSDLIARCPVCGIRPTSASRDLPTVDGIAGSGALPPLGPVKLSPCGHDVTPVSLGVSPSYPQVTREIRP